MNTILQENLVNVRQRIAQQCLASGRDPHSVQLLAVSKTFPLTAILEAHQAGQTRFGENYIQEGVDKSWPVAPDRSAMASRGIA